MNLFIDTNVLLSFYHFTSDDLEELRKLAVLVRQGEVRLLLPEQVVNEVRRNRANKIADALKRLRGQQLRLQFPQLCKDYTEYEDMRRIQGQYEALHASLMEHLERDIAQESLKADSVIQELFESAETIPTLPPILNRARLRMDTGNPPGKKGSLGDAIIWETLLAMGADEDDLYFVCDDGDYFSPLNDSLLDPYLLHEWSLTKNSQLHTYRRLSSFFEEAFPDIKLASELEKDFLIRKLASTTTFAKTKSVISKLYRFSDFTEAQTNEIVEAAVSNNQVYWIANDPPVKRFLKRVISGQKEHIDPENLRRLRYVLEEMEPYGEIPF
jgi:predicted nucleic acid-binding protein